MKRLATLGRTARQRTTTTTPLPSLSSKPSCILHPQQATIHTTTTSPNASLFDFFHKNTNPGHDPNNPKMASSIDPDPALPLLQSSLTPLPPLDVNDPNSTTALNQFLTTLATPSSPSDPEPKVILIGDASHGTSEFYAARAELTKHLIQHHGFNIVAVEADWPDAEAVDRYVRHRPGPGARASVGPQGETRKQGREAAFLRFPTCGFFFSSLPFWFGRRGVYVCVSGAG
jgi:hypothetical protein